MNDFLARFDDELTLKSGDSVKVIEIIDDNWARCQNIADSGRIGIVPISYLQIFLDNDASSSDNLPTLDNQPDVRSFFLNLK